MVSWECITHASSLSNDIKFLCRLLVGFQRWLMLHLRIWSMVKVCNFLWLIFASIVWFSYWMMGFDLA